MDRISNLPENLIGLILEKLCLVDRVKTSSLSRRWKLRWTFLSSLKLDKEFYRSGSRFSELSYAEYVTIIYGLVLQQRGDLKELDLYIPYHPESISSSFEHLISYVTRTNNLERLLLELYDSQFSVPSSTFSSINLRHLEICESDFDPPSWFKGFPNLTHFLLIRVNSEVDRISHFVSLCPQLVELVVDVACPSDQNILEIRAPKLTHLSVAGNIQQLSISNVETLESVSMLPYSFNSGVISISTNMFNFSENLKQLQRLSLNGAVCKMLGSNSAIRTFPQFDRVKSLEFCEVSLNDPDEILCFLSFCKCSPNVRKLLLTMDFVKRTRAADALELEPMPEKYISHDLGALERVDVGGIFGKEMELKIMELLLRISPVLEVMSVKFNLTVTDNAKLLFLQPLINLYRASTKAKIIFT